MLDERDLQAIAKIMDEKISASEERMSARMDQKLAASEERMSARMDQRLAASEERMSARMDQRLAASEERMSARMDQKLADQKLDLIQCMNVIIESEVTPKFNLLADEIAIIKKTMSALTHWRPLSKRIREKFLFLKKRNKRSTERAASEWTPLFYCLEG